MPEPRRAERKNSKLKRQVQSYNVIKKGSSFLTDSILNKFKSLEFPAVIEGKLVYSQKYQNRPIAKASVLLTFKKDNEEDITSVSVISDVNGYFSISTPTTALKYTQMIVNIERNGIAEKLLYSRGEAALSEGKLGNLVVKDDFYIGGIFEKVDSIVDNIGNTLSDTTIQTEQASANPKVTLGEGENAYSLSWANAPVFGYNYKILHRLIEPEVSPPAIISSDPTQNKQRSEIGCPIDVVKFKKKLVESPHSQPRMSSLGMGYVLLMNQEWKPSHFSLGTLLYSLALAPGEEQRLAISERAETLAVNDSEAASYYQSDSYSSSQRDDVSAIFSSALDNTINGNASMKGRNLGGSFGSGTAAAGGGSYGTFSILGGASAIFGIGGSTTSSSSSFYQKQDQDYTSNLAQSFQQNIQRAAKTQSQANRVGVRLASSTESEMVTTKIIANNNHSHALTMQFWEVVQNYIITSNITGVQLVLYIPLDLVQFLPTGVSHVLTPGELYEMTQNSSGKDNFMKRYDMLIKHYDSIVQCMPFQYCAGLNLLKKFASYPRWEFQSGDTEGGFTLQLKIKGSFMPYDNLTAVLRLKNGGYINASSLVYETNQIDQGYHRSSEVLEAIRRLRLEPTGTATGTFNIPPGIIDDNFASLELYYGSTTYNYNLTPDIPDFILDALPGKSAEEILSSPLVSVFFPMLKHQEAFTNPVVRLSPSQLRSLGSLRITEVELCRDAQTVYISVHRDELLTSKVTYATFDRVRTMTLEQLQEIERTFQHVVENTVHYSQTIWASLTSSERAIMLEQYTIGIPSTTGEIGEEIPLMNCVQNEVYGFYGNCMLMPFGYPPELAASLNTSTREVQDALYSYHTMAYRQTTTTVSVSTKGMVGEAVLGNSNASEKIDLTRYWNWQDSPITHADSIKPSDFDQQHIITDDTAASDKLAKTSNTVNISTGGATAPNVTSAVTQIPSSAALVGLEDLQKFASTLTTTASSDRQTVINNASTMTQKAIEGYVNMKAGLGMNGESKETKGKEQKKPEETQKPGSTENPQKPANTENPQKPTNTENPQKPS